MGLRHIAHVLLEDLDPVRDNRSPEEDGVGVVGQRSERGPLECETWSESLAEVAAEGDESSRVGGT